MQHASPAEPAELLRQLREHAATRPDTRSQSVSSTASSTASSASRAHPADEAYWVVHERNGRARPPQPGTVRWCYVTGEPPAVRAHLLPQKESLMPGVHVGLRGVGALSFDQRDKASLHNIILLAGGKCAHM